MKSIPIQHLLSVLLCLMAAISGIFFIETGENTWFGLLRKPTVVLPDYFLLAIWTISFILLAAAFFLIWKSDPAMNNQYKAAVIYFLLQLMFGALWPYTFFALQSPLAGLVIMFFILVFSSTAIIRCFRISVFAGYCMLPFFLLVVYLIYLNFSIWTLNA